jgi:hypothetical protein
MGKRMIKGAILGGLTGAGIVTYQAYQSDEPVEELASKAAQTGGILAALGAGIGLVFDRRSRKTSQRAALVAAYSAARAGDMTKARKLSKQAAKQAQVAARPRIEQAREVATAAAEAARPVLENWAEQAKPVAKEAAKNARELAIEAKEVATPYAKEYANKAMDSYAEFKPHAAKAAKHARKAAAKRAHEARKRADHARQQAAKRAHELDMKHAKDWAKEIREQTDDLIDARLHDLKAAKPNVLKLK